MTKQGHGSAELEELATARTMLDELRRQSASVEADIDAALTAGDTQAWIEATARARDLPVAIDAARARAERLEHSVEALAVREDLERAWPVAEQAHDEEMALEAELAGARERLEGLKRAAPPASDAMSVAGAEHRVRVAQQDGEVALAERRWSDSRDVAGFALFTIDELEQRHLDLVGSLPPGGDGLRARPVATAASTHLMPSEFGALAGKVYEMERAGRFLVKGTVPPRWVAHRLGSHLYEELPPSTAVLLRTLAESHLRAADLRGREQPIGADGEPVRSAGRVEKRGVVDESTGLERAVDVGLVIPDEVLEFLADPHSATVDEMAAAIVASNTRKALVPLRRAEPDGEADQSRSSSRVR